MFSGSGAPSNLTSHQGISRAYIYPYFVGTIYNEKPNIEFLNTFPISGKQKQAHSKSIVSKIPRGNQPVILI